MFVVAGVTGHVGSVVARELLAAGKQVRVIVRDEARGASWAERGAELAIGSLDDEAFLAGALEGAEGFFVLLPPNMGVSDLYAWQRATSDGIARAVQASGVPHVVLLSSVGADLGHSNGPIKGLNYLERALRGTGTQLTAIRAGYFQENIGNSLYPARQMGILPFFGPSAEYPMPMIATQDIGALAAASLINPRPHSEVVDLHGPAYSMNQVAEKLGAALGKPLQAVAVPQEAWVSTLLGAGLPPVWAEAFAEMYAGFASGQIQPVGDRFVQGATEIDVTIAAVLG